MRSLLVLLCIVLSSLGSTWAFPDPFKQQDQEETIRAFIQNLHNAGRSVFYETQRAFLFQFPERGFVVVPKIPINKVAVQNVDFDSESYLLPHIQATVYSGVDVDQDGRIDISHGSYESLEALSQLHPSNEYRKQGEKFNAWGKKEVQAILDDALNCAQADTFSFRNKEGKFYLVPQEGINAVHPMQVRIFKGTYGRLEVAPYHLTLAWDQLYTFRINYAHTPSEVERILDDLTKLHGIGSKEHDAIRLSFLRAWGYYKLGLMAENEGKNHLSWYRRGIDESIKARQHLYTLPEREKAVVFPKLKDIATACLKGYNRQVIAQETEFLHRPNHVIRIADSTSLSTSIDTLNVHTVQALYTMISIRLDNLNKARKLNMKAAFAFSDIALADNADDLLQTVQGYTEISRTLKRRLQYFKRQNQKPFNLFGSVEIKHTAPSF